MVILPWRERAEAYRNRGDLCTHTFRYSIRKVARLDYAEESPAGGGFKARQRYIPTKICRRHLTRFKRFSLPRWRRADGRFSEVFCFFYLHTICICLQCTKVHMNT